MSELRNLIQQITRFTFGVTISSGSFVWYGIPVTIIVILLSYGIFVYVDLFGVIDNMIETSKQNWFFGLWAKISFILNSIQISLRSLFSQFSNPLGRFIGVFITQLVSFIGTFITNYLLNTFIKTSENIPPETQFIYGLFPLLIGLIGFVMVRGIYNVRNFDLDDFLNSDRK
ncbi:MAG: hypothetical protein ACREAJ_01650 [Nitrosopumilaceae archaeon]